MLGCVPRVLASGPKLKRWLPAAEVRVFLNLCLPASPPVYLHTPAAVTASVKRSVVFASFIFTKQPARIRQVLNQVRVGNALPPHCVCCLLCACKPPIPTLAQVYESPAHVDDDLVRSISLPAQDPNGPEVRLAWACWWVPMLLIGARACNALRNPAWRLQGSQMPQGKGRRLTGC